MERYPELGNRVTISTEGGRDPRWSADGKELFFGSDDGAHLFAVTVTSADKLVAGSPQMLFESAMIPFAVGDQPYDVAPDGRFLVIRSEATGTGTASAPTLVLIQNWFEELKRLVR